MNVSDQWRQWRSMKNAMINAWTFGFKLMYMVDDFDDNGNDDINSNDDDGHTVNISTVLYTVRLVKVTLTRRISHQTVGQETRFRSSP